MKLDRNEKGRNKYALIKMRKLAEAERVHSPQGLMEIEHAVSVLEKAGILDYGDEPATEFFVIRLKDKFATSALYAYAIGAQTHGEEEYGGEVMQLCKRAAAHPNSKVPD